MAQQLSVLNAARAYHKCGQQTKAERPRFYSTVQMQESGALQRRPCLTSPYSRSLAAAALQAGTADQVLQPAHKALLRLRSFGIRPPSAEVRLSYELRCRTDA